MTESESWWRRHRWKVLVSVAIAGAFVWVLRAGALPLWPPRAAFESLEPWAVPGYLAAWGTVHFLRAARWSYLLRPVHPMPLRDVLVASWVGFAAILVLPLRTGEVVRPVMIRREGRLSGWAATGTVGAERVIDGLFLTLLLFVALQIAEPLDPLPSRIGEFDVPVSVVPTAAYTALGVFAAAFAAMGLFYWRRDLARSLTTRVVGIVSSRAATWLADRVESVAMGLRFLPRIRDTAPFLGMTAAYWLLNAAGTWVLLQGTGFEGAQYSQACVVMGVLAIGILAPNAPGFFGAFQLSVYAGLAMFFPSAEVVGPGALFVFLLYTCQLSTTLVVGAICLALGRTPLPAALGPPADEPR